MRRVPSLVLAVGIALSVLVPPASAQVARGHLVIIGGGERPPEIMQLIARLAGGSKGSLLVFPQASEVAETGRTLEAEFKALGLGTVTLIGINREGADTDAVLRQTEGATGV